VNVQHGASLLLLAPISFVGSVFSVSSGSSVNSTGSLNVTVNSFVVDATSSVNVSKEILFCVIIFLFIICLLF
jgi:uncharacterized membrane protein YbhN (UPF0104 family)